MRVQVPPIVIPFLQPFGARPMRRVLAWSFLALAALAPASAFADAPRAVISAQAKYPAGTLVFLDASASVSEPGLPVKWVFTPDLKYMAGKPTGDTRDGVWAMFPSANVAPGKYRAKLIVQGKPDKDKPDLTADADLVDFEIMSADAPKPAPPPADDPSKPTPTPAPAAGTAEAVGYAYAKALAAASAGALNAAASSDAADPQALIAASRAAFDAGLKSAVAPMEADMVRRFGSAASGAFDATKIPAVKTYLRGVASGILGGAGQ
jgi:hypothetical protein